MAKNQQYKNNPSGIIFGKNASLDVSGSFVASTANAMLFGNQDFFSVINPEPRSHKVRNSRSHSQHFCNLKPRR
ncbi:hypothetical protein BV378_27975 [Nostoc sp. RF31YmG]|jgi:hypothetical protein|nr:hypothetical protein BV378_27975 [Nostoc sp. RF31YmG]